MTVSKRGSWMLARVTPMRPPYLDGSRSDPLEVKPIHSTSTASPRCLTAACANHGTIHRDDRGVDHACGGPPRPVAIELRHPEARDARWIAGRGRRVISRPIRVRPSSWSCRSACAPSIARQFEDWLRRYNGAVELSRGISTTT